MEERTTASRYPAPPSFYKHFTDENLEALKEFQAKSQQPTQDATDAEPAQKDAGTQEEYYQPDAQGQGEYYPPDAQYGTYYGQPGPAQY